MILLSSYFLTIRSRIARFMPNLSRFSRFYVLICFLLFLLLVASEWLEASSSKVCYFTDTASDWRILAYCCSSNDISCSFIWDSVRVYSCSDDIWFKLFIGTLFSCIYLIWFIAFCASLLDIGLFYRPTIERFLWFTFDLFWFELRCGLLFLLILL